MSKRTFLYVSGGDYSAMDFSREYNVQDFYGDMIKGNENFVTIESEELYAEVKIVEFENVSDDFLNFVQNTLRDYDDQKAFDIFEVYPYK